MEPHELIAAGTAAEILDVSRTTIWRLVKVGDLPAYDVAGRGNVFDRSEVEALRDRRAARTARARALRYEGVAAVEAQKAS